MAIAFFSIGYVFAYCVDTNYGLGLILLSNLTLLSIFILTIFKKRFFVILISFIFISIFFIRGSNNGIETIKLLFFLVGQLLMFTSIYYNAFGKSVYYFTNRLFFLLILVHFGIFFNADEFALLNRSLTSIWTNPNSLAIAVLCPYILILQTTCRGKKYIIDSVFFILSFFKRFLIIYYTNSRSSMLVFVSANLLLIPLFKRKINFSFLFFMYLTPLLLPFLFYLIQKYISVNIMTEYKVFRNIWSVGVEQIIQLDTNYNSDIGLNSVLFGVNSYGFLYLLSYLAIGYVIYIKNKNKVITTGLILFSVLSIHEVFESSLASGFYGLIMFKVLLLIFYNYEKKQTTN